MTTFQSIAARAAGLRAAMEPADARKVPAEFENSADEWYGAYDGMSSAIRSGFASLRNISVQAASPTLQDEAEPFMPPTLPTPAKRIRRSTAPMTTSAGLR
jgi:hypothetical protein